MQKRNLKQIVFPFITAFIWGTAFIPQSKGMEYIGNYAFTAARSIIGSVELFAACLIMHRLGKIPERTAEESKKYRHDLLMGGLCCGTLLAIASNLQQYGLKFTSVSKAGFITALYIVLVPLFGIFLHKKVRALAWVSVALASAGLYLLTLAGEGELQFAKGDFYEFLCAIMFACHILSVDHFTKKVNAIELSCVQFIVMAVICTSGAVAFETTDGAMLWKCMPCILYVGVLSSGVAYTLQTLALKEGNPTTVSIIMSTESLFAAIAGAILLHERLTGGEYFGCVLMLSAVFLSQLPEKKKKEASPLR